MCLGGSPSIPAPVTTPKAETPKATTAAVTAAVSDRKTKVAAALGQQGSIVTSPFGVSSAASTRNGSLLGA